MSPLIITGSNKIEFEDADGVASIYRSAANKIHFKDNGSSGYVLYVSSSIIPKLSFNYDIGHPDNPSSGFYPNYTPEIIYDNDGNISHYKVTEVYGIGDDLEYIKKIVYNK